MLLHRAVLVGLIVLLAALGFDCWALRVTPAVAVLALASAIGTLLICWPALFRSMHGTPFPLTEAPFFAAFLLGLGLATRWLNRRRLMPKRSGRSNF
jgi:hypothetical protein